MRTIAAALALLVGTLSAVAAHPAAALERLSDEVRIAGRPLAISGRGNEAVVALLEEAERELGAGRPEQAAVVLERALRIEARNPTVWHYLGLARLDAGEYAQAETMASKSHNLAPGDRALRTRNARLVAAARQASGRTAGPLPGGADLEVFAVDRAQRTYTPLRQECRIWFSERPPSRQPPPIACDEAPRQLPPGAVLLVSI